MTRLLPALLGAALVACGPALGPATRPAPARATSGPQAQLFTSDRGFTFPLANGARVPIVNGWIEPHFDTLASQKSADLDVVIGADEGADAAAADVLVTYDMLEMAHGATTVHADRVSAGHHLAHLPMGMYGTWRIRVTVRMSGVTSETVLVLSGTGL